MPRLFIGIKIADQEKLIDLSTTLRKQLSDCIANWVDPKNFHLTLKFLGDVENYYINSIKTLLNDISLNHQSFNLQYNKLGYFGHRSQPKVIWFDFKPNNELTKLQQAIENSLIDLGFEPNEKKYSPHLTFARIKKISKAANLDEIIKLNSVYSEMIKIDSFQLIESILYPTGPVYTTVAEFSLKSN